MQNVAVGVAEEHQPVALIGEWFREQLDAPVAQFAKRRIEIIHANGQVPDAGILHLLRRALTLRWNYFEHRSISSANKIVAVVGVVDAKVEFLHVPLRQAGGIGRRNGGVFQSTEHKEDCSIQEAGGRMRETANWKKITSGMRGRWMLTIAGVVALGLIAGGFVAFHRSPVAPAPQRTVPVAPQEITLTGTIQAAQVMNVSVPVDGTIEQFMAAVGQHVSEGEILARIRNAKRATAQQIAKLDVEQAQSRLSQLESALIAARLEVSRSEADAIRIKSNLAQAEKTFDRQKTMFEEGVTPRLTYEKAAHEYNSLKAAAQDLEEIAKNAADRVNLTTKELEPARKELAQKNADLEDAEAETAVGEINSPADGVVIERRGRVGQPVTAAMTDMFQIALDPLVLEAVAAFQPQMSARIQPGQAVALLIAGAGDPTTGSVRELKSGQVFIDIKNPPPAMTRGMTVQIKVK